MARAGQLVASVLAELPRLLEPGLTTAMIDDHVRGHLQQAGGQALFHGYRGFPAHCCVSVNEEIVHGIPGARRLASGDIVTVDVGVRMDGYCADAARTYYVGSPSPAARHLVESCREALAAGIAEVRPGAVLSAVSRAIQSSVEGAGCRVVTEYVGHGIGRDMHEDPPVPNHLDSSSRAPEVVLEEGFVLAIEPMVTLGAPRVHTLSDGWTVVTSDGGLAAHWEHTVAVTADGARILTLLPGEYWPAGSTRIQPLPALCDRSAWESGGGCLTT